MCYDSPQVESPAKSNALRVRLVAVNNVSHKPQTKAFTRCSRQCHENITANKPMSGTFNKNTDRKIHSRKKQFPVKAP